MLEESKGQRQSNAHTHLPVAITLQNMKELKIVKPQKPKIENLNLRKTNSVSSPIKPANGSVLELANAGSSMSPRKAALLDQFQSQHFFEGQPEFRIRFTEVVRKFNHELMKSTCQVMKGCKSWTAKQIADAVFELLNEILQHIDNKMNTQARSLADSVGSEQEAGVKVRKIESISSNQQRFSTPHKSSAEGSSMPDDAQ